MSEHTPFWAVAEDEQLSSVIAALYDAGLEPELWPKALELVCAYVGGVSSMIFWQDALSQASRRLFSYNEDPAYTRLYIEKYIKFNPLLDTQLALPVGEVRSVSDTVSYDDFLASRFHREWAKPQGFGDAIAANLDKSATSYAAISVMRHIDDGPADDDARRRMRLLVPHMRRATLIGKIIDLKSLEASTFGEVIDSLQAGVFLLDATGRLAHANKAGTDLLTAADIVILSHDIFRTRDKVASRALDEACHSAARGAIGDQALALPLKNAAGEPYIATVLPLLPAAKHGRDLSQTAAVAVFLQKVTLPVAGPIGLVGQLHGLTKAELRVLAAIVEATSVPAAAAALKLSQRTVKAHLHSLFVKTKTHNQAELVKLVAAHSMPVGGSSGGCSY